MTQGNSYTVTRETDGSYRLRCTLPTPRVIATIAPVKDRADQVVGWKLKPVVVMQGASSHVWATPDQPIAATKLMTPGKAKAAIRAADALIVHPSASRSPSLTVSRPHEKEAPSSPVEASLKQGHGTRSRDIDP